MFGAALGILLLIALSAWAGYVIVKTSRRTARDVLSDLRALNTDLREARMGAAEDAQKLQGKLLQLDELSSIGLFGAEERRKFLLRRRLTPILVAIGVTVLTFIFVSSDFAKLYPVAMVGLLAGWLATRISISRRKEAYIRELEFQLPVVMERIVMAVQAGLDVISAMRRVIDLRHADDDPEKTIDDPVSRLLEIVCQLSEAGLGFVQSLEEVAKLVDCTAVRHAFIHLGMAYKEGGELVMPLMELSDSTQLYYQESVEEQIAKMPVKATVPLVVTFGGLIIFFLISPMIQIMDILGNMVVNKTPF